MGGLAFLLRYVTWPQAAAMARRAFVVQPLPAAPHRRPRALARPGRARRGFPVGILLYPLAVLALVLVFRHDLWMAAAVWGILAFGDGMATLVGLAAGGPRLPWNAAKSWAGTLAFVVCGTMAAVDPRRLDARPSHAGAACGPRILALTLPLALICALVESAPTTIDDNLTVPLAGALVLPLLAQADPRGLADIPDLRARVLTGLAVNGVIAGIAALAGWMDRYGSLSAVVIGVAITAGLGLPGLAVMVAFFVIGTAATRLGYRVKAARGIAQEKGGARGWRNAWANGGVPAFLALAGGGGGAAAGRRGGRAAAHGGLRRSRGHRGGGHLLLGGGQGLRPAHVPHHHAAPRGPGHRGRDQPRGDGRRTGGRRDRGRRWAAWSGSTRGRSPSSWARPDCSEAWPRA